VRDVLQNQQFLHGVLGMSGAAIQLRRHYTELQGRFESPLAGLGGTDSAKLAAGRGTRPVIGTREGSISMKNRELDAGWDYHNRTKHSYASISRNPHHLDWANQPLAFKIYPRLPALALPRQRSSSNVAALDAIAIPGNTADREVVPSIETLSELFFLSAGITKRKRYSGGEILFRAAACTGALYHIDLYLVCADLPGLKAGVYHYSPQDFSLRQLRAGDYRPYAVRASGNEASIANAPCIVISASTYWRNAWKYQSRAYRHCYWDNGTILANLLASAAARTIPAKVVIGFVDEEVNRLLALDSHREAPLSMVALGFAPSMAAAQSPSLEPVEFETIPLSEHEVDYPAISAMHEASSLASEEEVVIWRECEKNEGGTRKADTGKEGKVLALRPLSDEEMPRDSIEEVISRRGSTREFSGESITFAQLSTMLERSTRGIPADFLTGSEASLNDLYLIINAVDAVPSGAYVLRRDQGALELLKEGNFRRDAGYLGLGQELPADASVNIYFLADLNRALARFGNRGYRAAQLEAAIMGGKLYLAAYAQRLGASGLTFFDDDVSEFFSPHAAGKSVMFLIAVGKSVKRNA
jgi:SagB-type dehydrogenase family enzyme